MLKARLIISIVAFIFCSGCETALETDLTDKKPTLLAPANNLITTDSLNTFYWETIDGANNYQLQIVSPQFDSIARLATDTIINRNQFVMKLAPNIYEWRVRAMNSSTHSKYSDTFHLIIQ